MLFIGGKTLACAFGAVSFYARSALLDKAVRRGIVKNVLACLE